MDDPDHHYTLYLQNHIPAEWLRDLHDYPSSRVDWQKVNLREQFRLQFGFSPPPELNDAAIKDLELCNLPTPTYSETEDSTGWILGQLLHPVWQPTKPDPEHLANFVVWAVSAGQIKDVLAPLANARLKQWQQLDARYRIFLEQPWQSAGKQILLKWVLQSYPEDFKLRQQVAVAPTVDCSRHRQLVIEVCKIVIARFANSGKSGLPHRLLPVLRRLSN